MARKIEWDTDLAVQMCRDGSSLQEIAEAVGRNMTSVRRYLTRQIPAGSGYVVAARKPKWDIDKAKYMYYVEKMTFKQIAAALGVTAHTISDAFAQRGWYVRCQNYRAIGRLNGRKPAWDVDRAYELYRAGKTYEEIAAQVGTTKSCIGKYAINHNWKKRKRPGRHGARTWNSERGQEMFLEGYSFSEIAEHFGVSYSVVYNYAVLNKWHTPKPRILPADIDADVAMLLHSVGMTYADIGARYGVSGDMVRQAVKTRKEIYKECELIQQNESAYTVGDAKEQAGSR